MSRKGTAESFQVKITRNDRFAQMSHQEKVIEQKKKEIQAKLEQKQKGLASTEKSNVSPGTAKQDKGAQDSKKSLANFNIFSNDGSFLDQFKQMKEKKLEQQLKSFKRDNQDRHSDERSSSKSSRWSQRRRSSSPKERNNKSRISRFSEKVAPFDHKININTSYSSIITQQTSLDVQPQISINTHNVTGQPLMKNMIPPPSVAYPTPTSAPVIVAPPVLLNVPPPQVLQPQISSSSLVVPPPPSLSSTSILINTQSAGAQNVQTTTIITTENVIGGSAPSQTAIPVPPPCMPTVELSSIPPPNPIQVHNIPQPDPINTLTIPPPAPIQVQNIPPPSPIQLNEIPNPKPLDIMSIPTPNESMCTEKAISDPDFLKNVPPPNKSVPPPNLSDVNVHVGIPPPPPPNNIGAVSITSNLPTCLPPPNILPPPPPPPPQPQQSLQQNISLQNIPPPQNVLVHSMPPPQPLQQFSSHTTQVLAAPQQNTSISVTTVPLQTQLQASLVQPPVTVSNTIQPLMAHPVLPPPGMGLGPQHININCPPPMLQNVSNATLQTPPPVFVTQQLPAPNQMPPMNVPPPSTNSAIIAVEGMYKDLNAGSDDYEAMASLGRMVAQCGPGIEDIVRQRKPQDPSLWFLFYKDSAPYKQYESLIQQFKKETSSQQMHESTDSAGEKYEPEMALEDDSDLRTVKPNDNEYEESGDKFDTFSVNDRKRKRKSRWGEKDTSIPPPVVLGVSTPITLPPTIPLQSLPQSGSVMLSKITRNDPALIQYALNTFGSTNLSEEDWKKAEDHYKINLLYQDMLRKRQEVERLQKSGKNKYDYDSDEEIEGGTWEHKLREKEMLATQLWAAELTKQAEGKHHIGDFLPPEELKRFLEKSSAAKEGRQLNISDYKEFKLKEDNIGFKMLQKLGWSEGQGLGTNGSGIVEPVNKAAIRDHNQGLGLDQPDSLDNADDEYDAYRKRMMLAYRFRPNPLNNPRRPYY